MRRIVVLVVLAAVAALAGTPAHAGALLTISNPEFTNECGGTSGFSCLLYRVTVDGAACGADAVAEVFVASADEQPAVRGAGARSATRLADGVGRPILAFEPHGARKVFFQARCDADHAIVSNVIAVEVPRAGAASGGSATGAGDDELPQVLGATIERPGAHARAAISSSVREPGASGVGVAEYVAALLVAVAISLLVVVPSVLFNSTLEAHYDEVLGQVRDGRERLRLRPRDAVAVRMPQDDGVRTWVLTLVLIVSTVIYGMLDPDLGLDFSSAVQLVGIGVSLTVLTFLTGALTGAYVRWRTGSAAPRVTAYPWVIVVAIGCVVLSRALDFGPGYLYALVGGVTVGTALSTRDDGRSRALAALALLGVSLLAWFIWAPVAESAATASPARTTVVADGVLGSLVVAGIEGLILGLLPLRFLPGENVFAWSRAVWVALFAPGVFLYAHVVVRPAVGGDTAPGPSVLSALGLFVGFAIVLTTFWGYFRLRPARPELSPPRDRPLASPL